ncbi:hypothetical protein QQP08_012137 [Theobroma cacao]|nr:hypothetical protein QQP08_012137 [Theobroma cacao]
MAPWRYVSQGISYLGGSHKDSSWHCQGDRRRRRNQAVNSDADPQRKNSDADRSDDPDLRLDSRMPHHQ